MSMDLKKLRTEKQIAAKDMVEVIKREFPKYDKTIQSKCESSEYGIQLSPNAERLIADEFGIERRKNDGHKMKCRISCRLNDETYARLAKEIKQDGYDTVQKWLSATVEEYLKTKQRSRKKMIRNPNEIQNTKKKIRMLIAGYPGIGKSTLALSAPKPLHIDVDFGIDRIEPQFRCPYIQPKDYSEILDDLTPENTKDFETLVFDTGGKLISLMSMWAVKKDAKYGQRDGSLSLKGYGFVGREFVRLMDYCFYELQKNIVIVFHAIEDKDGDNTRLRIKVEGQTKNNVWEPMDLGGFVEIIGNNRTIGFSNCERYFAKGTRGIHGVYTIPDLSNGNANNFLTMLFEEYNKQSAAETEKSKAEQELYEKAMAEGKAIIEMITDAETANAQKDAFAMINHALTSSKELAVLWNLKMKELGLSWSKDKKGYEAAAEEAE